MYICENFVNVYYTDLNRQAAWEDWKSIIYRIEAQKVFPFFFSFWSSFFSEVDFVLKKKKRKKEWILW